MITITVHTSQRQATDDVETCSEAVLTAVANGEGVAVDELPRPLYDVVDPDALNTLFRSGRGEVSFEYLGYLVTVTHERDADRRVRVEAIEPRPGARRP